MNACSASSRFSQAVQSRTLTVGSPHRGARKMKKGIILWLLGVPVLGIVALKLFGII